MYVMYEYSVIHIPVYIYIYIYMCVCVYGVHQVRRAALKHLLEREYAMYEQELRGQEKAVYIQRT